METGQFRYVPEVYNDFIFTYIGETVGFIGCIAVLAALAFLCIRILHNALHALDDLGKFICVGVFAMMAIQIIINIGMCLGVLPVIGVTLPFFVRRRNFDRYPVSGNWCGAQRLYAQR